MFLYIEHQGTNPRVAPVTLHISIIIRLFKGIFGIRHLIKVRCGTRENAKYLDGKQDLTTGIHQKQDSSTFRHRMGDCFACLSGIWGSDCYPEGGSETHQNLETGYRIFFACLSGIREVVRSSGNCESNRRTFSGVSYPILSPSSFFFHFFPPFQYT